MIIVSNSKHIAGIDNFHRDVFLDDGKMELLLCKAKNNAELVGSFFKYFSGENTEQIVSLKATDIVIKFLDTPETNWCIDGEKFDYVGTDYVISVGDSIPIITPNENSKQLFKSKFSRYK